MIQKFLFLLMPLFVPVIADDNIIDWSASRKLTWSDFKGSPDPSSTNAALTNSGINVEFSFSEKEFTHSIRCRFNKEKSWGRIKNAYILQHEQGHFDITEVHARLLHRELSSYKINPKTANDDINKMYTAVMKQHVETQQAYDLQTNHSIDSSAQRAWNKQIDSLLNVYKKYADYR